MKTKRNYITIPELEQYANITVTDEDEALDNISRAEEIIDAFVGPQNRFLRGEYHIEVSGATGTSIFDTGSGNELDQTDNYFANTVAEVIAGTGQGQARFVVSSNRNDKSITVDEAFSPQLDTTSVIRVYQLAKFPRSYDYSLNRDGTKFYKFIPEGVKLAVAAQIQFMIEMGDSYFVSDQTDKQSENIGNYGYSKGSGGGNSSSIYKMIAPLARSHLKGLVQRGGRMIVDNPTNL